MNISALSSSVSSISSTSGIQSGQAVGASDPDGDGDGRVRKSHGRGGHMHDALMQALQSLGLNLPQGSATSGSSASASTGGDASTSGTSSTAANVKDDLHQFMHALFQAVKSESASTPIKTDSSSASSSGDPQSSFASGLSALIAQVGNGTAPAGLQDAFSKLATDLQGSTTSSSATGAASAAASTGSSASTQPSLQALLTTLQQDLGYGSSSTLALGNTVSAQA